jgi:AraC-like DNA-binding protein
VSSVLRELAPPPDLAEHVDRVWWRGGLLLPALPHPAVDLLVFPDGSLHLAGPETSAREGSVPTGGLTGIRLRPGSCPAVLGVAADEVPLMGAPLPGHGIEGAFRALRQRVTEPDQRVLQVLSAMHSEPGAAVSRHAADVGLSERQLRRRFAVAVGLSPKSYVRVIRLHKAMAAAHRSRVPRWAEIAQQSGFYDQPHMLAEFRRAVGSSCVRFFQAERAMAGQAEVYVHSRRDLPAPGAVLGQTTRAVH